MKEAKSKNAAMNQDDRFILGKLFAKQAESGVLHNASSLFANYYDCEVRATK